MKTLEKLYLEYNRVSAEILETPHWRVFGRRWRKLWVTKDLLRLQITAVTRQIAAERQTTGTTY